MRKRPAPQSTTPLAETIPLNRPSLAYPQGGASRQQRGTPSVAIAFLRDDSTAEAGLELWCALGETLREVVPLPPLDLDALQPASLISPLVHTLESHPDREGQTGAEIPQSSAHLQWLKDLRGGKPTKALRGLQQRAAELAATQEREFRARFTSHAAGTCIGVDVLAQEARLLLAALSFNESSSEPLLKCGRLLTSLAELERDQAIPTAKKEQLRARLKQLVASLLQQATQEVARQGANHAMRESVARLGPFFDELVSQAATCRRNLERVERLLRDRQRQQQVAITDSTATNSIRLESRSVETQIHTAKERLKANDRRELGQALREQFEIQLQALASERYPSLHAADAPWPRLVAHLATDDIADAFGRVVGSLLDEEHSLYQAIEQYGPRKLAAELFVKTDVTVDFSGRSCTKLRVEPQEIVQVRTPRPRSAEEAQTQAAFLEACFAISPRCRPSEGPAGETELMIVRLLVGFPISILGDNAMLLKAYATAGEIRHLPHLFNLLPDVAGDAHPPLVELARRRDPSPFSP